MKHAEITRSIPRRKISGDYLDPEILSGFRYKVFPGEAERCFFDRAAEQLGRPALRIREIRRARVPQVWHVEFEGEGNHFYSDNYPSYHLELVGLGDGDVFDLHDRNTAEKLGEMEIIQTVRQAESEEKDRDSLVQEGAVCIDLHEFHTIKPFAFSAIVRFSGIQLRASLLDQRCVIDGRGFIPCKTGNALLLKDMLPSESTPAGPEIWVTLSRSVAVAREKGLIAITENDHYTGIFRFQTAD